MSLAGLNLVVPRRDERRATVRLQFGLNLLAVNPFSNGPECDMPPSPSAFDVDQGRENGAWH